MYLCIDKKKNEEKKNSAQGVEGLTRNTGARSSDNFFMLNLSLYKRRAGNDEKKIF